MEVWNGSTPLENGFSLMLKVNIFIYYVYILQSVYIYAQRQVQECSYQDLFVVAYDWKIWSLTTAQSEIYPST